MLSSVHGYNGKKVRASFFSDARIWYYGENWWVVLPFLFFFTALRDWSKIPRVMCFNQSSQGNYQSISICNSKVCSPAFLRVVNVLTIWNYTCDILTQTQRHKNRSVLYLCRCHKKKITFRPLRGHLHGSSKSVRISIDMCVPFKKFDDVKNVYYR